MMSAGTAPVIREALPSDAAAVAALSAELGYPVPVGEMEKRLRYLIEVPDHAVLVACIPEATIIGWVDVGMEFHVQWGHFAEIGGLVVTEKARSAGVGKALVHAAEQWAAFGGAKRMRVLSNAIREGAHRFYLREGYEKIKTSAVFEKELE
jgi:GNAT superfamily N-acetyltransferase